MNVVDKMARLAMIGHNGTNRKGPGNVPYGGHNRAIVALLKKWGYTEPDDALTLAVAWGTISDIQTRTLIWYNLHHETRAFRPQDSL